MREYKVYLSKCKTDDAYFKYLIYLKNVVYQKVQCDIKEFGYHSHFSIYKKAIDH